MIYTVTLNPSLDYIVGIENFIPGKVNRTTKEQIFPGGKGINVSIVLQNLGLSSTALGFVCGFTGTEIKKRLEDMQISTDFVEVKNGSSRINVKLGNLREDGDLLEETEINGSGPEISDEEFAYLLCKFEKMQKQDILVLSGSIPASLPETTYKDILEKIGNEGVLTVVDAAKGLLLDALSCHPFLIKPNHHELGEMFGVTIIDKESAAVYARKLIEQGARNVLVSMAGNGAVLVTEEESAYAATAPKGKVLNSVGAGDSMVAGFLYGYIKEGDYRTALRYGVAAGSASAFSKTLTKRDDLQNLLEEITITEV